MSSRKIPFDENEKCDNCGKGGAFDFMGDFICGDCLRPDNKAIPMELRVSPKVADVRLLPQQEPRVETGAVQFGDDWQGLFISGDNCFAYTFDLQTIIESGMLNTNPILKIRMQTLLDLLRRIKE